MHINVLFYVTLVDGVSVCLYIIFCCLDLDGDVLGIAFLVVMWQDKLLLCNVILRGLSGDDGIE